MSDDQPEFAFKRPPAPHRRMHVAATSLDARERVVALGDGLRAQILAVVCDYAESPAKGATADEVHGLLANDRHQVADVRRLMEVRRRVSDLHTSLRLIRDTGLRRKNTEGNEMIVWAPVEELLDGR